MSASPLPGLGAPVQIAYAVPDAAAAAERWARDHGAGPFFLRPHIPLAEVVYRGGPAEFDHTSAYGQWGSIMVELVQVHTPAPNIGTDVLGDRPQGLHHLAFFVDDLDVTTAALARHGHALAMIARTANGSEFRFVDAVATHGHMLELYVGSDRFRAFYAMVADAAAGWDGSAPVREL